MISKKIAILAIMAVICAPMPLEASKKKDGLIAVNENKANPGEDLQGQQAILDAPCKVRGPLPDPQCTPGDRLPVTTREVCVSGYSKTVRNVPESLKKKVYESYGVTHHPKGSYEVDHLIPLSIGGSNDIKNLWPEAAEPKPGFRQKDGLENRLRSLVCKGDLMLEEAQAIISTNWVAGWVDFMEPKDNAGNFTQEGQP